MSFIDVPKRIAGKNVHELLAILENFLA